MPVSEAFKVVKGGFTTLAGEVDHVARAGVNALRRQFAALDGRVTVTEGDITTLEGQTAISSTLTSDGDGGFDDAGPTSAATELTVKTLTVPEPTVAGRVFGFATISTAVKSVNTDRFDVFLTIDGTKVSTYREIQGTAATSLSCTLVGSAAVDASGTVPVLLSVQRSSGTGTLTISAGDINCNLHYEFIPEPA
jgi:hypothetical protein